MREFSGWITERQQRNQITLTTTSTTAANGIKLNELRKKKLTTSTKQTSADTYCTFFFSYNLFEYACVFHSISYSTFNTHTHTHSLHYASWISSIERQRHTIHIYIYIFTIWSCFILILFHSALILFGCCCCYCSVSFAFLLCISSSPFSSSFLALPFIQYFRLICALYAVYLPFNFIFFFVGLVCQTIQPYELNGIFVCACMCAKFPGECNLCNNFSFFHLFLITLQMLWIPLFSENSLLLIFFLFSPPFQFLDYRLCVSKMKMNALKTVVEIHILLVYEMACSRFGDWKDYEFVWFSTHILFFCRLQCASFSALYTLAFFFFSFFFLFVSLFFESVYLFCTLRMRTITTMRWNIYNRI